MSFNKNIGVLGAGSWGTALVKMLSENCDKIFWHSRNDIQIKEIIKTKKNPKYLNCLLYTSPNPRDRQKTRMPSSA